MLKDKPTGVTVEIVTKPGGMRPSLPAAVKAFNAQYGGLEIRTSDAFHDRFIVIDDTEFYHLGASIKDVGKSGFMFSRIEGPTVQDSVRLLWTKAWADAKKV